MPGQDTTSDTRLAGLVRGLTRDGRGWTLAAVAIGWFLTLGTRFLIPTLLPQIKAEFGVGNATAGLAISVIWVFYGVTQFPSGLLVDRIGERVLLAVSLGLAAMSMALLSFAPLFVVFLVAAAVLGLGTGLYGPARGTVLSRTFSDSDSAAFGITLAAGSIGSALIPLVGGALVDSLGWRITMAISVPLFLLSALFAWRSIPVRTVRQTTRRSASKFGATLVGTLKRPSILVPAIGVMLMVFTYQGLTAFLPTYLIEAKGYSQPTAAALFALLFVAGAGFQLGAGALATRVGDRPVLVAIALIGVVSLASLTLVSSMVPLAILIVVMSTRLAVPPVMNAYLLDVLPGEVQGSAWGLMRSGFFLIGATGSTFVGTFADADLFDEAFYALAAVTVVALLIFVRLPDRSATSE
ncbi:MAG: MFS transporter [Halobacteriota archaeon]